MRTRQVRDLMIADVALINWNNDVHELEKLLLENRVHDVPVVDGDGILVEWPVRPICLRGTTTTAWTGPHSFSPRTAVAVGENNDQ